MYGAYALAKPIITGHTILTESLTTDVDVSDE